MPGEEKSNDFSKILLLLPLLRQRVARDLLQMRNLSAIWTVGRSPMDRSLFQRRCALAPLSVSGQRGRHCPEPPARIDVLVSVNASSGSFECFFSRTVDRFSSVSRFSFWGSGSPPPLSARHCLPALFCSSSAAIGRGKERKPLGRRIENVTSGVSMNYHLAPSSRSLVTPNGSIYPGLRNDLSRPVVDRRASALRG